MMRPDRVSGSMRTNVRRMLSDLFQRANDEWENGRLVAAFRLFLEGAEKGDTAAQVNIGYFYDVGIGTKRDRGRALYWYRRAYRGGQRTAAANIGTIYRDERKFSQAIAWFKRAVELGLCDANLDIAVIYAKALGQPGAALRHLQKIVGCGNNNVAQATLEDAQRMMHRLSHGKKQPNGK